MCDVVGGKPGARKGNEQTHDVDVSKPTILYSVPPGLSVNSYKSTDNRINHIDILQSQAV
jgi:hypothetical protein